MPPTPCEVIINRLALLAAPTLMLSSVLMLPGAAVAASGGDPASADPAGLHLLRGHQGTTASSTAGTPVVTTSGKASPGAADVHGSSVTATFAALLPNTPYVTGARCYLGVAGAFFTSDANGLGSATFDLSGLRVARSSSSWPHG